MPARSSKTGRFVKQATVARNPRTTVVQSSASSGAKGYRSAITGRFVTAATARRHPDTTMREGGH